MSQEYEFVKLTPDVYESLQHQITSSVAESRREIEDCCKAIYIGNKKIQELQNEIAEIQQKINEYKANLNDNQRSINVDTNFLNKLNRRVKWAKPTMVDSEKRLVKKYRKAK